MTEKCSTSRTGLWVGYGTREQAARSGWGGGGECHTTVGEIQTWTTESEMIQINQKSEAF